MDCAKLDDAPMVKKLHGEIFHMDSGCPSDSGRPAVQETLYLQGFYQLDHR
jgi:hypothetical protein